jgi:NAD(P)-dependent dehydrogenase (short-subunit alcohol dehydrogenase family)/rhamnose utilization protein RhaD (predicted bifunctional aldolase and dehydrogenase)
MKTEISELLKLSDFYGSNRDYVTGGGIVSFKDEKTIWIKPEGSPLAGLTEEGLQALSREKVRVVGIKQYSDDQVVRENEVNSDLAQSIIGTDSGKPLSRETLLHEIIQYKFVVHLHSSVINGLVCSRNARNLTSQLFGEKVLFVPYHDPGYMLFIKLRSEIAAFHEKNGNEPGIIFLENQGSIVSADSTSEIVEIYNGLIQKIRDIIPVEGEINNIPYNPVLNKVLPVIRMLLSDDLPKVIRGRHNDFIAGYYKSQQDYQKISHPLTPDIIISCKRHFLYVEQSSTPERIIESFKGQLGRFIKEFDFIPRVIVIKDMGVFAVEESYAAAESILDAFEDLVRISHYAQQCGGTRLLTPDQMAFIEKMESGNFRIKIPQDQETQNKLKNKVVVITGGARGLGAGIAVNVYSKLANIVVADLNDEEGKSLTKALNNSTSENVAVFVKTDVTDPVSVKDLISSAVQEFGGIDILICSAGFFKAGGLDETDPDIFSEITDVNYKGYFHCVKYASEIMKLQNSEKPGWFSDIIQINSKTGLRGSRNFAFAGAKSGGIGLTRSFALELAPFRIKVNSICPGSFYDGPLWSDPNDGLFFQYLKTGKVPGAKNIEDVRKFYEDKIPMKRGCRLDDLMKAVFYVIDQEYETGQAIPVTGGEIMLG